MVQSRLTLSCTMLKNGQFASQDFYSMFDRFSTLCMKELPLLNHKDTWATDWTHSDFLFLAISNKITIFPYVFILHFKWVNQPYQFLRMPYLSNWITVAASCLCFLGIPDVINYFHCLIIFVKSPLRGSEESLLLFEFHLTLSRRRSLS